MKKYFLLAFILFSGCKDKHVENLYKIGYCKPDKIKGQINTDKLDSVWKQINKHPKKSIEYLISLKSDYTTHYKPEGRLTYFSNSVSYYQNYGYRNNNSDCAAYLICAIYYNNYLFASDKILYDSKNVIYHPHRKKYFKYDVSTYSLENYKKSFVSSEEELELAWKLIINWWEENKDKSISTIRRGKRPFGDNSLYWIGEKNGKVNKNFKQGFEPYERKENP